MNQYIVTAYDYNNENALQHRMDVRPHHLEAVKTLKNNGNYLIGGAILNEKGNMIGTTIILQFETDEALDAWKQGEPYITVNVIGVEDFSLSFEMTIYYPAVI
jgi:uncharacterized protein YciI